LQVFDNFGGQDGGVRQIGRIAQTVVPEPEDVEIGLIALDQVLVGEAMEPLSLGPLVAIRGVIAADEVVEIGAGEGVRLQGEVLIGAEIVDPKRAAERRKPPVPAAGSMMAVPGWGRMTSTMASIRTRGVKYWPAPDLVSCAFFSSRPS